MGTHLAAQRDYRFQGYRSPNELSVVELHQSNMACDNIIKSSNQSLKTLTEHPTNTLQSKQVSAHSCLSNLSFGKNNEKWSNVSDELQNNKLFVSDTN